MDVEHPALEGGDEARREDPHEASQADEVHAAVPQRRGHGLPVGFAAGMGGRVDDHRLDARLGSGPEGAAAGAVGEERDHFCVAELPFFRSAQESAGVGTGTGSEDGNTGRH